MKTEFLVASRMIAFCAATNLFVCTFAAAQTVAVSPSELKDRAADEMALVTKQKAIESLTRLAKTHSNTRTEPAILIRLIETLQSSASIEFRISHGKVMKTGRTVVLTGYQNLLQQSVAYLNNFLKRFPNDSDIPRAYYLRGKAETELGQKVAAIADFRYLVDRYPQSPESSVAGFTACELMIQLRDYPTAIQYLKFLSKDPKSKDFPLATDRLAWVYYYMGDFVSARHYLEEELAFYRGRKNSRGDEVDREKAFLTVPVFYLAGASGKGQDFAIRDLVTYFEKLDPGPLMTKMLVQFGFLLRSKSLDNDLEELGNVVAVSDLTNRQKSEFGIVVGENELNKKRYDKLHRVAVHLAAILPKPETPADLEFSKKAKKFFMDAAARVQGELADDLGRRAEPEMAATLGSLYDILLTKCDLDSLEKSKVHYNQAETAFGRKEYDKAVTHYRWVVDNGSTSTPGEKEVFEKARVKAIAARYEDFKERKAFAEELRARPFAEDAGDPVSVVEVEWFKWIDELGENSKNPDPIEVYRFEANRLLYSQKRIKMATRRLFAFVRSFPSSKYAIPSASLIIDTYLASELWPEAYRVACDFTKVEAWKGTPFAAKVYVTAGDLHFKMTESIYKKSDHQQTLKRCDEFQKLYPTNSHMNECLAFSASSSLALGDKAAASQSFAVLGKKNALTPELMSTSILTDAAIAEERYDLAGASNLYLRYLEHPNASKDMDSDKVDALREKVLFFAWISGDSALLKKTLSSNGMCQAKLSEKCETYEAILVWDGYGKPIKFPMAKAKSSSGSSRLIWAALALEQNKISLKDRYEALSDVAEQWGKQDPFLRYALLPRLMRSMPETVASARFQIRSAFPIKMDPAAIKKRTKSVQELEEKSEALLALPWSRIQIMALNELAGVYSDFSREMAAIRLPKGLSSEEKTAMTQTLSEMRAPFDQKRDVLRVKAFDAALSGKDEDLIQDVLTQIASENQAKELELRTKWIANRGSQARGLTPDALAQIDPDIWKKTSDAQLSSLRIELKRAMDLKAWPRIAYLIHEADQKKALSASEMKIVTGCSLAIAGAIAEALVELSAANDILRPEQRTRLANLLVSQRTPASVVPQGGGR